MSSLFQISFFRLSLLGIGLIKHSLLSKKKQLMFHVEQSNPVYVMKTNETRHATVIGCTFNTVSESFNGLVETFDTEKEASRVIPFKVRLTNLDGLVNLLAILSEIVPMQFEEAHANRIAHLQNLIKLRMGGLDKNLINSKIKSWIEATFTEAKCERFAKDLVGLDLNITKEAFTPETQEVAAWEEDARGNRVVTLTEKVSDPKPIEFYTIAPFVTATTTEEAYA